MDNQISNLVNLPVSFTLSGKEYKIQRLSPIDLFGRLENMVKENYMDGIISYAERIKDKQERLAFQREAIKDVPKGKDMQEAIKLLGDTVDGGIKLMSVALSKLNNVTEEEVKSIVIDPANDTVIATLMDYIVGADIDKKTEEASKGDGAEKATEAPENPEKKTQMTSDSIDK